MIFQGPGFLIKKKAFWYRFGVSSVPYKITILQEDDNLSIKKTLIVEYADDQIVEEHFTIDGGEYPSKYMNSPAKTLVSWADEKNKINIRINAESNMGAQKSEVNVDETWSIEDAGKTLVIKQISNTPWGKRDITTVYNRIKNETGY